MLFFFFKIIFFDLLCRSPCLHRLYGSSLLSWAIPVFEGGYAATLRPPGPQARDNQIDPSLERTLQPSCSCTPVINLSSCYSAVQWYGTGWNIRGLFMNGSTEFASYQDTQPWLSIPVATVSITQRVFSYINHVLLSTGDLPCLQMHPWNMCHQGCVTFTEFCNFRNSGKVIYLVLCWPVTNSEGEWIHSYIRTEKLISDKAKASPFSKEGDQHRARKLSILAFCTAEEHLGNRYPDIN